MEIALAFVAGVTVLYLVLGGGGKASTHGQILASGGRVWLPVDPGEWYAKQSMIHTGLKPPTSAMASVGDSVDVVYGTSATPWCVVEITITAMDSSGITGTATSLRGAGDPGFQLLHPEDQPNLPSAVSGLDPRFVYVDLGS